MTIQMNKANLYGYDMVYAVKSSTINDYFRRLFAKKRKYKEKVIPYWYHRKENDEIPDATIIFSSPVITIPDNPNGKIYVLFPFESSSVIFDGEAKSLQGCGMRCTVNVEDAVVKKENISFQSESEQFTLDKNSALLDQDTLKQVYDFLNEKNPFDLKQFFFNLNGLKYGKDIIFDSTESIVHWKDEEKRRLGLMTEKIYEHFKKEDITSVTIGFAPVKNNEQKEIDHKVHYTNTRVLPYYNDRNDSSGLVYCMVTNKQGKLPPEQPFNMDLYLEDAKGMVYIKRELLSKVIFETIKQQAFNYDYDHLLDNPFAEFLKSVDWIDDTRFKITCNEMRFDRVDKDNKIYKFLPPLFFNSEIKLKLTFREKSNNIFIVYDMLFTYVKNKNITKPDGNHVFKILGVIDTKYHVINGEIKPEDSDYKLITEKEDIKYYEREADEDDLANNRLVMIQKNAHKKSESMIAAAYDTNLLQKHFQWMALTKYSSPLHELAKLSLGTIIMFDNDLFWFRNLKFVTINDCPLISIETTYKK